MPADPTLEEYLQDLSFIQSDTLRRLTAESIQSLLATQDILLRLLDELHAEDLDKLVSRQQSGEYTYPVSQQYQRPAYRTGSPYEVEDQSIPLEERFEHAWNTASTPTPTTTPDRGTDQSTDLGLLQAEAHPDLPQ